MVIALSSFELHKVVEELQVLIGAKIEKIFQQNPPKDEFLFVLHIPNAGKRYLYLLLPDVICMTSFKPDFPDVPPHFCASLRRKISNARIRKISQEGFERIINIDVETKNGLSRVVIEFLAPGNIVLHLPDNKILSVLHPKVWNEERRLLPAKQYAYPPAQTNPFTLTQESFKELLLASDKDALVKSLAVDCSLGGTYAQEVLVDTSVDKNTPPQEVSYDDLNVVFKSLSTLLHKPTNAVVNETKAYPFKLQSKDGEFQEIDSYNEALASIALSQLEATQEKQSMKGHKEQLSKVDKILKAQENQLKGLEKSKVAQREKGDLIYNNYMPIKELFAQIDDLRKSHSWKEIKEILQDNPLVDSIDEHEGKIYLELN